MSNSSKILLGIAAFFFTLFVWLGLTAIHYHDFGNTAETALTQKRDNLENVMSAGLQSVMGKVQVADMYSQDITKAYMSAITAREGVDGSQAFVKVLRESNPHLSEKLYSDIGDEIKVTQEELKQMQSQFLQQKSQYERALGAFWSGMWLRIMGYPQLNLADLKIATTAAAQKAYKTGVAEDLKLRK